MSANRLRQRCPRLGHEVPFSYCLGCGDNDQPCWKIADCWWEHFDVVKYLNDHYPEAQVAELLSARPPSKVSSLMTLIKQARQRIQNNKGETS